MGILNKLFKADNSCNCEDVEKLTVKEVQEEEKSTGGSDCGDGCPQMETDATNLNNKLSIKILGSGCKYCVTLTENVKTALNEMKLEATVIKVTDLGEITGYGVMSTPAMVVNEKVVSYGKVLKPKEVIKILEKVVN